MRLQEPKEQSAEAHHVESVVLGTRLGLESQLAMFLGPTRKSENLPFRHINVFLSQKCLDLRVVGLNSARFPTQLVVHASKGR